MRRLPSFAVARKQHNQILLDRRPYPIVLCTTALIMLGILLMRYPRSLEPVQMNARFV